LLPLDSSDHDEQNVKKICSWWQHNAPILGNALQQCDCKVPEASHGRDHLHRHWTKRRKHQQPRCGNSPIGQQYLLIYLWSLCFQTCTTHVCCCSSCYTYSSNTTHINTSQPPNPMVDDNKHRTCVCFVSFVLKCPKQTDNMYVHILGLRLCAFFVQIDHQRIYVLYYKAPPPQVQIG